MTYYILTCTVKKYPKSPAYYCGRLIDYGCFTCNIANMKYFEYFLSILLVYIKLIFISNIIQKRKFFKNFKIKKLHKIITTISKYDKIPEEFMIENRKL